MLFILALIIVSAFTIVFLPPLRRLIFTGFLFHFFLKFAPKISPIERQAIKAGSDGFDKELFSGSPDWDHFRAVPSIQLTQEEQSFLDGPTKKFCAALNDWDIRGIKRDVSDETWDFAKKHGLLGLRASKKASGHGFSAQAQSIILGMIASRSIDASTTVGVSNSLGPDELLEEYGTREQKEKYLNALVSGEEIAAFAVTSQNAGSDAASMRDVGYIEYGDFEGKKVLGITVSWSKRYITLAPRATVLVLAFRLFDPKKILKGSEDRGITLALIPTKHQGVVIGRRHLPGGTAFPNGPTEGKDVFIPIEWVLGGKEGIGQGWKMAMQNIAAGRGVSIPSMSVAVVKFMLRVTTAYARIRRQFNKPIGKIEGVQEALTRMIEAAYVTEAARAVTAAMVTRENRPLVLTSILKYQSTEYARRTINDAMDIHGGKGIIDGPSNYLQSAYQIAPIAITVEGANILTRSLITTGQAILRSHPYFKKELEAFEQTGDEREAIRMFDLALTGHIALFASNVFFALFHNITRSAFAYAGGAPVRIKQWYRRLTHASRRFAFIADIVIMVYRNTLKKKQKIGGRLSDALSELYLMACVLKRYEDDGMQVDDYPIVELCLRNGLYRFETALHMLIVNIRFIPMRWILRFVAGSWVHARQPASDSLGARAVELVLTPSKTRDRLTRHIYLPEQATDPIHQLEIAMEKVVSIEPTLTKVEQAIKSGTIRRYLNVDWIKEAEKKGILSKDEAVCLREADELVQRVSAVDSFDAREVWGILHER